LRIGAFPSISVNPRDQRSKSCGRLGFSKFGGFTADHAIYADADLHSTGPVRALNFLGVRCERSTMDSVVASEAIDLGSIPSARTSLAQKRQWKLRISWSGSTATKGQVGGDCLKPPKDCHGEARRGHPSERSAGCHGRRTSLAMTILMESRFSDDLEDHALLATHSPLLRLRRGRAT
jgi:hypothetical protein